MWWAESSVCARISDANRELLRKEKRLAGVDRQLKVPPGSKVISVARERLEAEVRGLPYDFEREWF